MKALKIAGITSASILLCFSAFVAARQAGTENTSQAPQHPARQVEKSFDDIDRTISQAMEQVRRALILQTRRPR